MGGVQGQGRGGDRAAAALSDAPGLPGAGPAAAAAQVSGSVDAGQGLLARRARRARLRQDGEPRRYCLHLRSDAAKALAVALVPLALRPHHRLARLGARPRRPGQAADQELVSAVRPEARRPHAAAPLAHSPTRTGGARGGVSRAPHPAALYSHMKCTACGANSPIAMNPRPTRASPPASQDRISIPVMTVAEASTIPIWNAAEATS